MKLWQYQNSSSNLSLLKKNPLLAHLLAARGIDTDEKADIFLNPEKKDYLPFSVFKDAEKVITRIKTALEQKEKIIVYGDFDTDGVTSTAILYKTLKKIGADVDYYLPDRDEESHGLNNKAVLTLISKQKAKLIITVDCGISNAAEVKLAKSFKADVIITDHHEAPEVLPEAFAIINPKAQGVLDEKTSAEDIESLCYLSGAGIAFKLASAILTEFNEKDFIKELEPIAALGTIGDIVPLKAENRRIAACGIRAMQNGVNLGIKRLFENADKKNLAAINSEAVAFVAVPRINAVGRLKKADISLKLLISDDINEIDEITKILNDTNDKRQKLCDEAFNRAKEQVEANPELYKNAIVICDEETHVGILGLSASKLVETYAKPAFVMRKDENMYRCSCRGLKGVNIYEILNENAELFAGYGGHELAGGFSFDGNVTTFEKVKEAIDNTVDEQTGGQEIPDILNIDLKINPEDINMNLVETVKMLAPFGAANPVPVFSAEKIRIADIRFMGQNKNHMKLICTGENGTVLECVKWFTSEFAGEKDEEINLAFTPETNEFNGKISVQLMIKDVQFTDADSHQEKSTYKIIDCRTQQGGFDKIYDFLQTTKKSVAIFAENNKTTEECKKNEIFSYCFTRDEIPENKDMIIFADMPPSHAFLKKCMQKNKKEMLFMKYKEPTEDAKEILSKIAGMLKYAKSSYDGKTTVVALRNALNFEEDILLTALDLFKDTGFADFEITDGKQIKIKEFQSIPTSRIVKENKFLDFAEKYLGYINHAKAINTLQPENFKKYILK